MGHNLNIAGKQRVVLRFAKVVFLRWLVQSLGLLAANTGAVRDYAQRRDVSKTGPISKFSERVS